jgi:hypothetical protein
MAAEQKDSSTEKIGLNAEQKWMRRLVPNGIV